VLHFLCFLCLLVATVLQGNEYFQRKSYLTALHEYSVSVLSAPSADSDSMCQQSATESGSVEDGKPESIVDNSAGSEPTKTVDDNAGDKLPETDAKDESTCNIEQKSTGDAVKEDKGSNKNELALAFANRFC